MAIELASRDTIVVNTINNAHSRYTGYAFTGFIELHGQYYGVNADGIFELVGDNDFDGDVSFETPIEAYCVTPITDFDVQEQKSVGDAFVQGRFLGDMEIDLTINEGDTLDGFSIPHDGNDGIHRKRVKLPRGLKGTDWQFKVKNVNGSDFTLFDLDVAVRQLQRTI